MGPWYAPILLVFKGMHGDIVVLTHHEAEGSHVLVAYPCGTDYSMFGTRSSHTMRTGTNFVVPVHTILSPS